MVKYILAAFGLIVFVVAIAVANNPTQVTFANETTQSNNTVCEQPCDQPCKMVGGECVPCDPSECSTTKTSAHNINATSVKASVCVGSEMDCNGPCIPYEDCTPEQKAKCEAMKASCDAQKTSADAQKVSVTSYEGSCDKTTSCGMNKQSTDATKAATVEPTKVALDDGC